jgi:hypothetical protein
MGLADEDWGEGGVEEGVEELRCEGLAISHLGLGGRRFRKTPSVGLFFDWADTFLGGPGEAGWRIGLVCDLWCCLHGTPPLVGMGSLGVDLRVGELYRRERGRLKGGGWRTRSLRTKRVVERGGGDYSAMGFGGRGVRSVPHSGHLDVAFGMSMRM